MTLAEWLASVTAYDVRLLGLRESPDPEAAPIPPEVAGWYDGLRVRDARALVAGCEALAYLGTAMRALCGYEWEPRRAVWLAADRLRWANE